MEIDRVVKFKNAFAKVHDMVNNDSYTFIAPVVFFGILLFAFFISFWIGRRSSLYFFFGTITSLVIAVIVLIFLKNIFINSLDGLDFSFGSLKMSDLIDRGSYYVKSLLGGIFVVIFMLLIFLIQLLIYPFIRKRLKRKIKDIKSNNGSVISRRVSGGFIGIITAVPFVVILATYSSIFGANSGLNNSFEKMQNIVTFGQVKETNYNAKQIINTFYYFDVIQDRASDIASIFGSKDITDKDVLKDLLANGTHTKEAIENLIGNSFLTDNFDLVLKMIPENIVEGIDLTRTDTVVDWVNPIPDDLRLSLTHSGFAKLTENIAKGLNAGDEAKATTAGVAHFFKEINLFNLNK